MDPSVWFGTHKNQYRQLPSEKSAQKRIDFTGTSEIPLPSRWRGQEEGLCVKSVVSILVKISFTNKN